MLGVGPSDSRDGLGGEGGILHELPAEAGAQDAAAVDGHPAGGPSPAADRGRCRGHAEGGGGRRAAGDGDGGGAERQGGWDTEGQLGEGEEDGSSPRGGWGSHWGGGAGCRGKI